MIISSTLSILNPPSSSHLHHQKLQNPIDPNSHLIKPTNFKYPIHDSTVQKNSTHNQNLKQLIHSMKLSEAKKLYVESRRNGTQFGVVLESMLIDALMKSGFVDDAFQVFDEMYQRNIVTWTSMIRGCVLNDIPMVGLYLFVEMLESDVIPNDYAFNAAIQACAVLVALRFVEQLVSLIIRWGLAGDPRTRICLMEFYCKCGLMDEAVRIFDRLVEVDLVSFTSLIAGFIRNSMFDSAIRVFNRMVRDGVQPNEHTITSVLMVCGFRPGQQIHAYMIKTMIDKSVYSSTALIELYSSSNEFECAKLVFEKLENKNVVTWSSMISHCLNNDQVSDALIMFCTMVSAGTKPNEFTFATVIGACGMCMQYLKLGHQLHCLVIKLNLVVNNRVSNALITMYSKNGEVEELGKVLQGNESLDVASWCAAVSGFFQNGLYERSINLLREMHNQGYTPNEYGLSSSLSSCANLALPAQGRQFHCLALKSGCDFDVCTGNAVINMYGKCGFLNDAKLAFDLMTTHDVTSWNSLIHTYAYHGHGRIAIEIFDEMVELGHFSPNGSTFLAILVACNHMGCADEAMEYFSAMEKLYGITPSSSHCACMIDIMGRAGLLSEALCILEQMPSEPDVLIWKALLGSCRLHGNLELGKIVADKVFDLSPNDSAAYVLLSNLHAMHGEWGDVERVRKVMEEKGGKKDAGWSWIEIDNKVHSFIARDESHPKSEMIYQRLVELSEAIKGASFKFTHAEWKI